jgi:glycosyltransferase involved in cell wall biosynthesis
MTGEYPRATDTFIQREVATLRRLGHTIETFSIRKPASREVVSPEVQAERDRSFYVLPAKIGGLLADHAGLLLKSPGRYFAGLRLAMQIRPPGVKAFARQLAYFAEAGVVASRVQKLNLQHLHNHFSNSSCSVAVIAATLGGFTFSFTMHGPAEFYEPHVWRIDEKVRRALFVNCISHFARSQAMVFAPVETWDKLHIVHCGVDPAEFDANDRLANGSRLLFVGRLAAVKGLPILLRSIAALREEHPHIVLNLAGDGPDRSMLEKLATDLGIADRVLFLGYRAQSEIRALLKGTDVFVMTSFAEGVPVVLMEAMAAGVPVIATRIAGVPELVEDRTTGLLIPPGDVAATTAAIGTLLRDRELRERFSKAGREKVEREFNINCESMWLAQILDAALHGRREVIRPT